MTPPAPSKRFLVIPSNREDRLREFFRAWRGRGGWDTVIAVQDGPTASFTVQSEDMTCRHLHFAWDSIKNIMGDDSWIISRRDSAIRCFGFLAAWHLGADYVLTLDDDCYPPSWCGEGSEFFQAHIEAMQQEKWVTSAGCRTRGLPWRNFGSFETCANMGMWTGSGDPDAVESMARTHSPSSSPQWSGGVFLPRRGTVVVPYGQYVPVCGMNLCIARRALPLFWFPLMGETTAGEVQPFRRFDDIWAGVLAKRVMDVIGWSLSVGEPWVDHRRASDPMRNLVAEAPGIAANESFWQVVDDAGIRPTNAPLSTYALLGEWLGHVAQESSHDFPDTPYLNRIGRAMQVWEKWFDAAETLKFFPQ